MHSSLTELLENLKSGLLWVQRDGVVRYANADAAGRTGLAIGRKVYDPDLAQAVAATVAGQEARLVTAVGPSSAQGSRLNELKCRVIPGLARDDAFVLIGADTSAATGSSFDNLMQVIRADLAEPLREAGNALQLARGHQGGHEIDPLLDGVQEMMRVLDRLVDLAQLWGNGALVANDRIELWPLLQSVWSETEPLAISRSIKVRFRAQTEADSLATLYGSEHWLRRVFLECLESAVRSSVRGATLEIEHRQMGPRALIVFRDCGMFAPRAGIDMPRGSKAPMPTPRPSARDQIGLKLCQHIISLHGGELREEQDGGERNFLVELPTGAPHHAENAGMDMAQAQQYAKDLAALMARARNKGATSH